MAAPSPPETGNRRSRFGRTTTNNNTRSDSSSSSMSGKFTPINVLCIVLGALFCQTVLFGNKNDFSFVGLDQEVSKSSSSSSSSSTTTTATTTTPRFSAEQIKLLRASNPLVIPPGQAENLPSIRHEDTTLNSVRKIYGGEGDGKHLGGFTEIDMQGLSPTVWKFMVQNMTIQSVLDVGCGRGISTSWFYTHGLRTQCVEGSHDAVMRSMIPDKSLVVEHDFSRGPWWPEQTFDAVWAVEFLEHVNIQFHYNYISTFRKAALIFATSSRWGGWHHVEVHPDEWWIRKYEMYGFKYDPILTQEIRKLAKWEMNQHIKFPPTDKDFLAQHVSMSMKVFVNPAVASLPEHAHLFAKFGCYKNRGPGGIEDIINKECGTGKGGETETKLDPTYHPLQLTAEQDQAWEKIVSDNIDKAKMG